MGQRNDFHNLVRLFESDSSLYPSDDIFDLVLKYIIHPIFEKELRDKQQIIKNFGVSKLLEFKIFVNDIRNYMNEVIHRLIEVIKVKMKYHHLQTILDRVAQVYTTGALRYFDIPKLIYDNCFYLTSHEKQKISSYLRIL